MNKNSIFSFGLAAVLLAGVPLLSFGEAKVGSAAPSFELTSIDGKKVSLNDYKGKVVVLEWFNPSCPFVQKHYNTHHMQDLQDQYTAKGVVWLTINSTNPSHENYLDPTQAAAKAKDLGMKSTAILPDPDGKIGKEYGAKSTPHMFIIDPSGNVAYEGAIDDNPSPKADPAKATNYVQQALDEVLAGKPVSKSETKQYGCNIKYAK
jgi:peroxiredoxin